MKKYTDEVLDFIKENIKKSRVELTEMVNAKFNINISVVSLKKAINQYKLNALKNDLTKRYNRDRVRVNGKSVKYSNYRYTLATNKKVPPNHSVVFINNNRDDFSIDNMVVLPTYYLSYVNYLGGFTNNEKHNRTIIKHIKSLMLLKQIKNKERNITK